MKKFELGRGRMEKIVAILAAIVTVTGAAAPGRADGIAVQSGQKVAFLGDSITEQGWNKPAGYVQMVVSALDTNGVKIVPVPAGISGHTSRDMVSRLDRDVLSKKPDWMTLSCGVNDVWHGAGGVPLNQYKINITYIVDIAQASGIKVMLLTSTPIFEDQNNSLNKQLVPYNDFLRQLAPQKNCLLADLNAGMQDGLKAAAGKSLTVDGVHMNGRGDMIMASGILKAFGMSDDQLAKAREVWLDIPNGWGINEWYADKGSRKALSARADLTIRQHEALVAAESAKNQNLDAEAKAFFDGDIKALLKPDGQYDNVDAIYAANQQAAVQKQLQDQFAQQIAGLTTPAK